MDLAGFFGEEGIDVFSAVGIGDLPDEDQESVGDFFPEARSVIVFGKEVPVEIYRMPARDKTRGMLRIAESLDRSAKLLAERLNDENIPARAVPLYLPIRIAKGKVQGLVRLKHVAKVGGLGSMGMNTVLLSPRFGPRLLLSGVVTGRPVEEFARAVVPPGGVSTTGVGKKIEAGKGHGPGSEPGEKPGSLSVGGPGEPPGTGIRGKDVAVTGAGTDVETEGSLKCTMCGKCARICPGGAIGPEGVDVFRCRTIRAFVPPVLVPTVKLMLGRRLLLSVMAPLAPLVARGATIRCSLCITECPKFEGAEKKEA